MLKEEILRLLREDAAFREEVRRQVLTDEVLGLPHTVDLLRAEMHQEFGRVWQSIEALTERLGTLTARVDGLAEQMAVLTRRVDGLAEQMAVLTRRVDSLAEQMATLARRVDSLAEQMATLTRRVDGLAEQMAVLTRRVDTLAEQVAALTTRMDNLASQVQDLAQRMGRLEERWGLAHEQMAQDLLPEILRRKGWVVRKAAPLVFDGEMDLVVEVEAGGRVFTVAAEVKGRVWSRTPMDQVLVKIRQPAFVAAAERAGFPQPFVPAVFGLLVYAGAEEAARQAGVGLYSPAGELVAAVPQG